MKLGVRKFKILRCVIFERPIYLIEEIIELIRICLIEETGNNFFRRKLKIANAFSADFIYLSHKFQSLKRRRKGLFKLL